MLVSEVPGILVAMPALKDTYFEKSVILLCSYDAEGAFGLVMNHPSTTQVNEVLSEELQENAVFDIPLLVGGPVQPESFWAVHSADFAVEETTILSPKINLSSAHDILSLTHLSPLSKSLSQRLSFKFSCAARLARLKSPTSTALKFPGE